MKKRAAAFWAAGLLFLSLIGSSYAIDQIQSGAEGQQVAIQKVNLETANPAVQTWVSTHKTTPGIHSQTFDGKTFVLVSRGEKPNPGYGITVTNVTEEPDRVLVSVEIRNPKPGMFYSAVITTPYDLVAIPQTNKPIVLQNPVEQ